MMTKTTAPNINQPILKHEASSAIAKAQRLRELRKITKFTREEIAKMSGAQFSTYKGWENAKYNGIPKRRAYYLTKNLATEGIKCTVEWIMNGIGNEPEKISLLPNNNADINKTLFQHNHPENNLIAEELSFFQQRHQDSLALTITDDGMEPFYTIGDTVAGIKLPEKSIKKAIGNHCIVQTRQNEILVRKLEMGQKQDHYTLLCLNSNTKEKSILYDMELIHIAPILWHRRNYSF